MSRNIAHLMEAVSIRDALYAEWDTPPEHNHAHLMSASDRLLVAEETKKFYVYLKQTLQAALEGDIESAKRVTALSSNRYRGYIAMLLYLWDVPVEGYREALDQAWGHDHREVIAAAKNRTRLRAMFRKAHYPLPEHLPDVVRVYRGTSYLSFREATRGLSWTTDRDVACWFAMRFADTNGHPLLLAADVPKSAILHYSHGRKEAEAVCFDVPSPFIDGTVEDWQVGMDRCDESRKGMPESTAIARNPC